MLIEFKSPEDKPVYVSTQGVAGITNGPAIASGPSTTSPSAYVWLIGVPYPIQVCGTAESAGWALSRNPVGMPRPGRTA